MRQLYRKGECLVYILPDGTVWEARLAMKLSKEVAYIQIWPDRLKSPTTRFCLYVNVYTGERLGVGDKPIQTRRAYESLNLQGHRELQEPQEENSDDPS